MTSTQDQYTLSSSGPSESQPNESNSSNPSLADLRRHAQLLMSLTVRKSEVEREMLGLLRTLPKSISSQSSPHTTAAHLLPTSPSSVMPTSHNITETLSTKIDELSRERNQLNSQLTTLQERTSTLIKDKIMLAKRIEQAVEEKSVLMESLKENVSVLSEENSRLQRELEEMRKRQEELLSHRDISSFTNKLPNETTVHANHGNTSAFPKTSNGDASAERVHQAVIAVEQMRDTKFQQRVYTHSNRNGLLSSIWALIFGRPPSQKKPTRDQDESRCDDAVMV
jgi:FtsZ-binding cell division protein ZapB